jgi:hypothetical protein
VRHLCGAIRRKTARQTSQECGILSAAQKQHEQVGRNADSGHCQIERDADAASGLFVSQ